MIATRISFKVAINGKPIEDIEDDIVLLTVETSLSLPGMFHMILADHQQVDEFKYLDSQQVKVGNEVKILVQDKGRGSTPETLIEGNITSIEPDFRGDGTLQIHIRGYDDSIRLSQGKKIASFKKKTDSDIIAGIAQANSLKCMVDPTTVVRESVIQYNQSDWDFIQYLARRNGLQVLFENKTLTCKKPKNIQNASLTLEFGNELKSFRPRVKAVGQITEATATSWDVKTKKAVTKTVKSQDFSAAYSKISSETVSKMTGTLNFKNPVDRVVDLQASSENDLKSFANGMAMDYTGEYVSAEGECIPGQPKLQAGDILAVKGVGKKFSGNYAITTSRHEFSHGHYRTIFTSRGPEPETFQNLLGSRTQQNDQRLSGVVPGIVTNNDDAESDFKSGKIKVQYPWFDDKIESDWARVAVLGGGPKRGFYFTPAVGDEVLVAFEHGDINRPYILGGLWNGKDLPPGDGKKVVDKGKVNVQTIQTRSGHKIVLDDTDGSETIMVVDKSSKNSIILDTKKETITIKSGKDIVFDAGGKLTFKCVGEFEVEAKGASKIQSQSSIELVATDAAKLESKQSVAIAAGPMNKVNLSASGVDVQGVKVGVKGSAMTEISGALVKIN